MTFASERSLFGSDNPDSAQSLLASAPSATDTEPGRAKKSMAGDGSWVAAGRVVSQVAQFLIILCAARFLAPVEFGTFALVSVLAIGLTRFSEAGWREYVIAAETDGARNQANTLAALCGAGSLVLGLGCAVAFWKYAGLESVAAVMALLAVWVLLTTLSSTQAGMLVRGGRLKTLALAQIVGEVAGLGAAIAAFAAGGGVLGLAIAKLVTQALTFVGSLVGTRRFPLPSIDRAAATDAVHFSRRILATRLIGYFQDNIGTLAVGALAGPAATGLFRAAARLASALSEVVSEPMRMLSWSAFDRRRPGPAFDRICEWSVIGATPLFVGLAVTADHAVNILLGSDWAASWPVLSAFAIANWLSMLNVMTEPLLVRGGRVDLVPRVSLVLTGVQLTILLCTAPFGILAIAVGQIVGAVLTLPFVFWILHRFGGVSIRNLGRQVLPAIVGAAALVIAVKATGDYLPPHLPEWGRAALKVLSGAVAYAAVVALLARNAFARANSKAD